MSTLDTLEDMLDAARLRYEIAERDLLIHKEIYRYSENDLETVRALYRGASEACADLRARLAALEAERAALRQWVRDEGERTDTCTYNVLREVCAGCRCHRATPDAGRTGGEGAA